MSGPVSPPAAAGEGTRIPVRPKRLVRAAFASQLLQDLPAVLTVLAAGASAIRSEREDGALALAAAELLVGAWVLVTLAREARHLFGRHAHHDASPAPARRVEVPLLAAAAMGYVEAWHHAHARGHFKLVNPYMLGATVNLFLALGGRRWIRGRTWYPMRNRRPHLLVTSEALTYRGGRWRRWTAPWGDVAAVEHGADALVVRLHDGRRYTIRAADHLGGAGLLVAARDAVDAHAPLHLAGGAGPAPHGPSPNDQR